MCGIGCCGYRGPRIESTPNATWFTQLAKENPGLLFREIAYPGTHDSATYSISPNRCLSSAARTQNLSVYDQLSKGSRFLDIRVGGTGTKNDGVNIYHGPFAGAKFTHILEELKQFADDHPGEFAVIDLIQEHGRKLTEEQKKFIIEKTVEVLGNKMAGDFDWRKTTIGEIAASKKNYYFVLKPTLLTYILGAETFKEADGKAKNLFNRGSKLRNLWHETNELYPLLEKNLNEVSGKGQTDKGKLLNNQFTLTPKVSGTMDIIKLVCGCNSIRPDNLARVYYKTNKLGRFIRDNADQKWNSVFFDFLDFHPTLADYLISLNFPQKIKIIKTTASSKSGVEHDFTEKLKSFLRRDNSVYLLSIPLELGLPFMTGTLKVVFEKEGVVYKHSVEFKKYTQYLLSHYKTSKGSVEKEDGIPQNPELTPLTKPELEKKDLDAGES